jgi:hypothetical protein
MVIYPKSRAKLSLKIDLYEGFWNQNKQCGAGRLIKRSGKVYQGKWDNNKLDGHGKRMEENGVSHQGTFSEGKIHGKGLEL